MRRAVKANKVVFQFGTQQRSDREFRHAIELVRNGYIGDLETVMIGSAGYEQIPRQPEQPVPAGFDYDFWLGPAPWSPYTFERCTRQWTLISDYSLGCISGAWGIHSVDMVQLVNRSDNATPVTCEGTATIPTRGFYDTPQHFEIEHIYKNGMRLLHMDMDTARTRAKQFNLFHMAILFLGHEGWIYVGRGYLAAEPKSLLKVKLSPGADHIPYSNDHRRNFLDCVKSRQTPVSSVDSAFYSDVTCHQGYITAMLGRKLTWDAEKEQFTDADANRLLSRSMRSPWSL